MQSTKGNQQFKENLRNISNDTTRSILTSVNNNKETTDKLGDSSCRIDTSDNGKNKSNANDAPKGSSQVGSGAKTGPAIGPNGKTTDESSRGPTNHALRFQQSQSKSSAGGQDAARLSASGLRGSTGRQGGASSVLDGATTNKASTPTSSSVKLDSDLMNVANENRVVLNVGGIRHETYRVSMRAKMRPFLKQPHYREQTTDHRYLNVVRRHSKRYPLLDCQGLQKTWQTMIL